MQLSIRKGINCKGSCVPDSGPPSGIRVTVFRGRIDCCDLMNVLYKGQVLQTAIIVRGKYCLYYAKLVFNCLCVIILKGDKME